MNGIRVFGIWAYGRRLEEEPFQRVGNSYNLSEFNATYFQNLHDWVEHAEQRGITVLFELFDSCGIFDPNVSKYNPFFEYIGNSLSKFTKPTDELLAIQKRYVEKWS